MESAIFNEANYSSETNISASFHVMSQRMRYTLCWLSSETRLQAITLEIAMSNKIFVGAALLLPIASLAKGSSGFGSLLIIAAILGGAYVFMLVVFGGPIILINKLAGRRADDELGGKVFALSFVLGPLIGVPLMSMFGKEFAGLGLIVGWGISIFLLNYFLSKEK